MVITGHDISGNLLQTLYFDMSLMSFARCDMQVYFRSFGGDISFADCTLRQINLSGSFFTISDGTHISNTDPDVVPLTFINCVGRLIGTFTGEELDTAGTVAFCYANQSYIICGSVISFYLKTVHDSVPQIADAPDTVNALDLVQSMVSNPMFFVYELAIVGMFVMVWLFRSSKLKHSWVWAVIFGTLTEFVIMLGGSLFLNDSRGLTQITVGSLVTLIVGILLFFVFQDLDFKRVETVQFSDDEYYYYVTAVPRIRLAEEDKEIKKITGSGEDSEAEEEKEVEE